MERLLRYLVPLPCGGPISARRPSSREREAPATGRRRAYGLAFAIGTALAGAAGTLVSLGFLISPSIGLKWALKASIVIVLVGLGSAFGTLVGGIVLGCAGALSAVLIKGAYREVVGLLLFFRVLVARPQGLFGRS